MTSQPGEGGGGKSTQGKGGHHLRIDKGYPGGAAHFENCSYNYGSYIHVLYIL